MDRAPSVVYPVGRTRALAWVLAVLAGSGAVLLFSVLFWPMTPVQRAPEAIVLIVSWLGAVAAMWHFWRRQRPRQLRWDGECWFVVAPTDAVEQGGEGARGCDGSGAFGGLSRRSHARPSLGAGGAGRQRCRALVFSAFLADDARPACARSYCFDSFMVGRRGSDVAFLAPPAPAPVALGRRMLVRRRADRCRGARRRGRAGRGALGCAALDAAVVSSRRCRRARAVAVGRSGKRARALAPAALCAIFTADFGICRRSAVIRGRTRLMSGASLF